MRQSIRERVRKVLMDGRWHTGLDLCRRCGVIYGTGLTAKIRDLRKAEFGGHIIESQRNEFLSRWWGRQVWEYRMLP